MKTKHLFYLHFASNYDSLETFPPEVHSIYQLEDSWKSTVKYLYSYTYKQDQSTKSEEKPPVNLG